MKITYALLAAAAVLSASPAALAQAARPAAQAPAAAQTPLPSRPGPTIAGICVVDNEQAILSSQVGAAYQARMRALTQQVQAELQPEQTAIQNEATAIRALPQGAARTQRENAFRTRLQNHQNRGALRTRELEVTQARQLQRLGNELRPVLDQVYAARNCGIMLDRTAVVAVNPAMDVSQAVTQALNSRITTITFDRERLDQQQPAAPAAR